jgi:uncharacterized protein YyaL (SSP411 family)
MRNMSGKSTNRLAKEKSPYLLQHAHNPVDWFPWCEGAFEKARAGDMPVFLSIGYSTCHWCHVMERESFEDAEVAAILNRDFVCIKVDREERPDIDGIYMTICQALTGGGGWPLTIVMTPEKVPFYAATYLPKTARFGQKGLLELLPLLVDAWKNRRDEILKSARTIAGTAVRSSLYLPGAELDESHFERAFPELEKRFDGVHGGFGDSPKFPTPQNVLYLLRYWRRAGNRKALKMAEETLSAMRNGGIFDQVGFGFHRYSTDAKWLVPHFEKMLYDQALISLAYTEAFMATGRESLGKSVWEIFEYVINDLSSPEGAFYSAEDADSEGEEGRFYTWSRAELAKLLGQDAELFEKVFNIRKDGNYLDPAHGTRTGLNIPHMQKPLEEICAELDIGPAKVFEMRHRVFEARSRRVRPLRDDKVLCDWNGLMIAALARGDRAFGEPIYARAAQRAAEFILRKCRLADGRLAHRWRDGEAAVPANLDDYAFLVWGLIELYEATFNSAWLAKAVELNDEFILRFRDARFGGFFLTADDAETVLARQKPFYDGAVPSGNSITMMNLLRLARFTGRHELEEMASRLGRTISVNASAAPATYLWLLCALDFALGPSREIVIVGKPGIPDTDEMLKAVRGRYMPDSVLLFKPAEGGSEIEAIAPFTRDMKAIGGRATAYVCANHACSSPVTGIEELLKLL